MALTSSPAAAAGTVTVSVQGQGSVTGAGINCTQTGGPDCSQFYADTVEQWCDPELKPPCHDEFIPPDVEFTAAAGQNGFVFDQWTGCDSVSGVGNRTCHLTVTSSTTVTAQFRDSQAPSVVGPSPTSGVYRGTIALGAGASDNAGVTKVEFYNGASKLGEDGSAPYQLAWDTTMVTDGLKSVTAKAYDAAGNVTTSAASGITVDNTVPTLAVTSGPNGGTFGPGSTQTWSFSASDATALSVHCSVQPTGTSPSFGACSGGSASHTVTNAPGGSHQFSVRATDGAGNLTMVQRSFVIDAIAPTVTSRKPAPNAVIADRTPVISAIVKDKRTASLAGRMTQARIKLFVDGVSQPFTYDAATGLVRRLSTRLSRTVHTVRIVANDAVGNVTESQWTFRVS